MLGLPLVAYFGYQHVGQLLGKGGCAKVYKGLDVNSGNVVALKEFRLTQISRSQLQEILVCCYSSLLL